MIESGKTRNETRKYAQITRKTAQKPRKEKPRSSWESAGLIHRTKDQGKPSRRNEATHASRKETPMSATAPVGRSNHCDRIYRLSHRHASAGDRPLDHLRHDRRQLFTADGG